MLSKKILSVQKLLFYHIRKLHITDQRKAGALSEQIFSKELRYGAHNYHPIPVALCEGQGCYVFDVEGKRYLDFLAGYSAINQGHCHPKIVAALHEQSKKLNLTSRAFYNDQLSKLEEHMHHMFGYDKFLPTNTGVEAIEACFKIVRRWGYDVKKIPKDQAKIIVCENNFHGRSMFAVSASTDPEAFTGFGPYIPNLIKIPFNNADKLEEVIKDPTVCGFIVEPIQGEAGIIISTKGYLKKCRELCDKYGVLLIADEVQTGLGRTGKMLCCDHECVRPDLVALGKSLGGGVIPVSGALADNSVMLVIKPGQHGSTFGGNPLASRVAIVALNVICEENLCQNAEKQGHALRCIMKSLPKEIVDSTRGVGLFNAIVINKSKSFDIAP